MKLKGFKCRLLPMDAASGCLKRFYFSASCPNVLFKGASLPLQVPLEPHLSVRLHKHKGTE